jgi:thiamine transport system ATP-binding protein
MLRIEGATVRFGTTPALSDVDLEVGAGERLAILGPSGSGKSTLLRVVAGLQPLDAGRVLLDGNDARELPPHRRGTVLMFQDGMLFPHLSVIDNVAYGLRMRGVARPRRRDRAAELLELVGLPPAEFGGRAVTRLSGGEQQRVALARALAPDPEVLLLDEPFASLDAVLRGRLVDEVRDLAARLGTTVLAVTHDRAEAFAFADRVAVMGAGRIDQVGPPAALLQAPVNAVAARLLGLTVLPAAVLAAGSGLVGIRPGGARILTAGQRDAEGADVVPGVVLSSVVGGAGLEVLVLLDGPGPERSRRLRVDASFDAPHAAGDRIRVALRRDARVNVPDLAD